MDWFRSWHGAPTDTKWLVIARRAQVAPGIVSAVAWALMDYASQNTNRGSIEGFDVETYATWAGWEEADVIAVIAAMHIKGIITDDQRLAAWDKRQPRREDDSAPRVAAFRERQRALQEDVTQCNAGNAGVTSGNAPDEIQIREDERREEKSVIYETSVRDQAVGDRPTEYPPGFSDFERMFRGNLLTAVQERDPGQRFPSGFSLADTSKAALLQVMTGGPLLSANAITWALDQWETSKPSERFDAAKASCVNWLLATIKNSYKPGKNGNDPRKPWRGKPEDPAQLSDYEALKRHYVGKHGDIIEH